MDNVADGKVHLVRVSSRTYTSRNREVELSHVFHTKLIENHRRGVSFSGKVVFKTSLGTDGMLVPGRSYEATMHSILNYSR